MLRAVTSSLGANKSWAPGVSAETLDRVERAGGSLATRSVALMDERLPWFRSLPAQQRSWVTLVAQAGISGYVVWARSPGTEYRITGEVFGTAPRDLVRAVSLRRTVELVRIAILVAEEDLPALAANGAEQIALRDSLLRYSREVAFAAASVYAAAAETRGAWDARVEAAVVDGIVRGEDFGSLSSRAAALDWDPTADTLVIAGLAPAGDRADTVAAVAEWAASAGRAAMAGVHGDRLVIVLAGSAAPGEEIAELFGDGTVVRGRPGSGLREAVVSTADALAGLDVAAAWPAARRTIDEADLLAERVLGGDQRAAARLRAAVYAPLAAAPSPLLATMEAYLATGGAWNRRLAICSCTPTPFVTGCTGSPTSPGATHGTRAICSSCRPPSSWADLPNRHDLLVTPTLVVGDFLQKIPQDLVPTDTSDRSTIVFG